MQVHNSIKSMIIVIYLNIYTLTKTTNIPKKKVYALVGIFYDSLGHEMCDHLFLFFVLHIFLSLRPIDGYKNISCSVCILHAN